MEQKERWRSIPGTDKMYQLSSLGRVRSWRGYRGEKRRAKPRLLKGRQNRGFEPSFVIFGTDNKSHEYSLETLRRMTWGKEVPKFESPKVAEAAPAKEVVVKSTEGFKLVPRNESTVSAKYAPVMEAFFAGKDECVAVIMDASIPAIERGLYHVRKHDERFKGVKIRRRKNPTTGDVEIRLYK